MTTGAPPPAGWYRDPVNPALWRWWDGIAWSMHTAPFADHYGYRSPRVSYPEEAKLVPWAKAAVICFPLLSISNDLIIWANSKAWANYFHALRTTFSANGSGFVAPTPQPPPWGDLLLPFTLAAEIVFFVWQYRSATTARRLGFPARRSPGWGIGSYFVPVVQCWMPYQALRDCLPPGSPRRPVVLYSWLLLLVAAVLNLALLPALPLAHRVGLSLLALSVACNVALVFYGIQVVQAIDAAHREALGP